MITVTAGPQATAEHAYVSTKNKLMNSTSRAAACLARLGLVGFLATGMSSFAHAAEIDANQTPQGASVVAGSATITYPDASSLIVDQASQRAVIDWQSFNIGENASAHFNQPNAASIAVNRVTGAGTNPTQILGSLSSNGQVMVLDRNGVLFGSGARVDVGGLVASTGDIDQAQFMAGGNMLDLTGMASGTVENRGAITAAQGGLVALVAPVVGNSGTITANMGRIELAAGNSVTLDLYGDKLVQLVVNEEVADALVSNSGSITANGGRVALTTAAAQGVVDDVINMTGIISAQTMGGSEGRIILKGSDHGTVRVGGTTDARGIESADSKGGYVEITGATVSFDGATIDASGNAGGGTIHAGGGLYGLIDGVKTVSSHTSVSADSVMHADALDNGNGGTVIVWGGEQTDFNGTVTARGGASGGDGGFVEVSTGDGVFFNGFVDTTAANGKTGQLLIDPPTFNISNAPHGGPSFNAGVLAANMASNNVSLSATSIITILEDIDLSAGGNALTLTAPTLSVFGDVTMSATSDIILNATTNLNLDGVFLSGGNLMGAPRISGIAPQVNVMSNAASIQQALDAAADAATVSVAAGTYIGNYILSRAVTLSGLPGDLLTEGADTGAPVLKGATAGGTIMQVDASSGVTISGFAFSGDVDGVAANNSATAISATNSDGLSINNNDFDAFAASAVDLTGGDGVTVEYNAFTNTVLGTEVTSSGTANLVVANNTVTEPPPPDNGGGDTGGGDTGGGDTGGGDTGGGDTGGGDTGGGDTGGGDTGGGDTGGGDTGGGDTGGGDTGGGDTGGGDTGGGDTGGGDDDDGQCHPDKPHKAWHWHKGKWKHHNTKHAHHKKHHHAKTFKSKVKAKAKSIFKKVVKAIKSIKKAKSAKRR